MFEEGLIIPPIKLVERGEVQEDVLRLILNNVRLPEMNRADLFAIVAGCRAGERRVIELCERFGKDVYLAALQALLDRTHAAMRTLIGLAIPEEPQTFEDWIDDDGLGNGPYKMKLTIWREGDHAWFDWSGTDPQALGPINFYLSEGMFKMFIGVYLIMVNDPQILFNDGFYPLLHVVMPEGSLLRPRHPAALGCRTHALTRLFDVLGGALTKQAPELNTAAGYGTSPYMLYSGWGEDGRFFYAMEILYGGIPGRPIGDGMDGHSWWPLFENIPTEYLEAYYPLRIDGYTTVTDSGGAGFHRGGNGVEKRYVYLEPGHVSIHDDRWLTRPWGVLGGEPGERSSKLLRRADGTEEVLPAKCDEVEVQPGDMLDLPDRGRRRLEGPAGPAGRGGRARRGLRAGLAREGADRLRRRAGRRRRASTRRRRRPSGRGSAAERGDAPAFDFGPSLEDTLAACEAETGLPAPRRATPLRWSPLEDARRGPGARAGGVGGRGGGRRRARAVTAPGFGGAAGFGARAGGRRRRPDPRLHRPGLRARGRTLDAEVEPPRGAVLDAARAARRPRRLHHDRLRRGRTRPRPRSSCARCPRWASWRRARRGSEIDERLAPRATSPCWSRRSRRRSSGRRWRRCSPAATRSSCAARPRRAACARPSWTRCSTT